MLQMPARPDRRRLRIERQPDPSSLEILRGVDARAGIDENVAVPEHPRRKHRNGDEWAVTGSVQACVLGGRKLGDVEFLAPDHAVEDVPARFERDAVEVDALDRDISVADGLHAIVPATGEGQRKTGHGRRLNDAAGLGTLPCRQAHAARKTSLCTGRPVGAALTHATARWGRIDQRLENWNERRALALPYFLRSTTRESRV